MKLENIGLSKRAEKSLKNAGFITAEEIAAYISDNSGWCMCESNEKGCLRGIGRKTGKEILDHLYAGGIMSESEYKRQILNITLSSFEKDGRHRRIHPRERDQILSHS